MFCVDEFSPGVGAVCLRPLAWPVPNVRAGLLEDMNARAADVYVGRAQRNSKMALTTSRRAAKPKAPGGAGPASKAAAGGGARAQRNADAATFALLQAQHQDEGEDEDDENPNDYYFSD